MKKVKRLKQSDIQRVCEEMKAAYRKLFPEAEVTIELRLCTYAEPKWAVIPIYAGLGQIKYFSTWDELISNAMEVLNR